MTPFGKRPILSKDGVMQYDFTELFYFCDEFVSGFLKELKKRQLGPRPPRSMMSTSEIVTILISFHLSGYHDFKHFFDFVRRYHRRDFPNILSYSRFVELIPHTAVYLFAMMNVLKGESISGIAFIDATSIAVCKNKRIHSNKVFKNLAKRGKTTMGWFFGFKLHLAINEVGQIIDFSFGPGNEDDRKHAKNILKNFSGTAYGDKGYISKKLFRELLAVGVKLVTSIRANMKPQIMSIKESIELGKRSLVESVFNVLKNSCRIEHSRHRSIKNFVTNLLSGLCAYSLRFFLKNAPTISNVKSLA